MVSKVFPRDRLDEMTMTFAERIAARPSMTALLVKEAVNQTQDIQGFYNALKASFSLHQLNHAHFAEATKGERTMGWVDLQTARRTPIQPSRKTEAGFVVETPAPGG
jgi:enoyl-CoA hydratase